MQATRATSKAGQFKGCTIFGAAANMATVTITFTDSHTITLTNDRPGDRLESRLVMLRAIRAYYEETGVKVGFKPAGGIRSAKQSLDWLMLIKEELGDEWMQPNLFRIGASALVNDIERQLEHFAYGRYASMQYQALG